MTTSKPTRAKAARTPAPTPEPEARACGCGCGAAVSPRASFRPGHDARHAGATGRALAANPKDKAALAALAGMSEALQAKAERVRANAEAKAQRAKAEAESAA
ncbi:hypothetical protein [Nocardioides bizhenqiangii]|uniref:Uncharacterized protein n=1 Tax=Nocardioides bizhenqiangii TaxID=3095076 RepID=A0ABZ0ZUR8_9ACTN|nr:hypothetical protein [Nocardioides sp. HM61]WQQ27649.1 hypothetical protein SHK19_05290 [Nocardioides sp. HM61]